MQNLVELALSIHDGDTKSKEVSPIVKKALKQHRQDQEAAAGNEIVELLRRVEQTKLKGRSEIRRFKAALKDVVDSLNRLDRAWAYAEQTSNFLPVLNHFGLVNRSSLSDPGQFDELVVVPADFKE